MSAQEEGNSCCVKMSKFILILVNACFMVLGMAVCGLGLTLIIKAPTWFHASDQAVLTTSALYGAVIFGAALMAIATFGCFGAIKGDKCCGKFFVTIYAILILVVIIAQVTCVAFAFMEAGTFGTAAEESDVTKKAEDAKIAAINAYVNGTYKDCCIMGNRTTGPPSINTQDVVCNALNSVVTPGTDMCGKGKKEFRQNLLKFFQTSFKQFGIGAIVCAVIEVICLAAACHVMRRAGANANANGKSPMAHNPNGAAPAAYNTQGGNLAFGSSDASKPLQGGFR